MVKAPTALPNSIFASPSRKALSSRIFSSLKINETIYRSEPVKGYLMLDRKWKAGDTVSIRLAMPVTVNMANPAVRENLYQVAVSRGPLIYCIEEADNGKDLHLLSLGDEPNFKLEHKSNLLGGATLISADALVYKADWQGKGLYAGAEKPEYAKTRIKLIPYYTWANRGAGEMKVWIYR
ncbi:MAG: glycoside hydrolase family 127 protein [Spirochaetaceae bacterium]|nr:glycoside hydrolase family 127 protein [Spirochaetaceae bacterium]